MLISLTKTLSQFGFWPKFNLCSTIEAGLRLEIKSVINLWNCFAHGANKVGD